MKKFLFVFSFLVFTSVKLLADSPLTSTYFAIAYNDVTLIADINKQRAEKEIYNFELTENHLRFFDNAGISLDQKIALINALGWGESNNLTTFKKHLAKKYKLDIEILNEILTEPVSENQPFDSRAEAISNDDLILLSYVQIMHDYFNPMKAFQCAYHAVIANKESEASCYVIGLLLAQFYMDSDWCSIFNVMVSVRDASDYTKDRMRPEAVTAIFEYIGLYESACVADTGLEEANNEFSVIGDYSAEYWKEHPVYVKPAANFISDKNQFVDLILENSQKNDEQIFGNWITYDEEQDGTLVKVKILNRGNVPSIETNLQMEIFEMVGDEMQATMIVQENIPVIQPGETVTVSIRIIGYWIYDPDADFSLKVDFDDVIKESNEDNNQRRFSEYG